MNPKDYTVTQWMNIVAFALASLATGGWWTDFLSPQTAAFATGGLAYIVSLLNFMVSGPTVPKPPAA